MDYTKPEPILLPGPDFNKHVHDFDVMKQIWEQNQYHQRVRVEADIMITLEALKTSVQYMEEDTFSIAKFLKEQYLGIKANVLETDIRELEDQWHKTMEYMEAAQEKCRNCE